MKLEQFEQALLTGGQKALRELGDCRICVVVDWRENAEEIANAVKAKLPDGYLHVHRIDPETVELQCVARTLRLRIGETRDTEPVLDSINHLLMPDYEMRILKAAIGDGYSLLLRPSRWWKDFEIAYPGRIRKHFITTSERVAQTGTGTPLDEIPKGKWCQRLLGR